MTEEEWLQKSADVINQQRQAIGLNHELEHTQFINFKDIRNELDSNSSILGYDTGNHSMILRSSDLSQMDAYQMLNQ